MKTQLTQIRRKMKQGHHQIRIILALIIATMLPPMGTGTVAMAQRVFESGSTGADGALDFSDVAPDTIILFDPTEFNPPLDPEGDNVYHFTTITIPTDVTVRLRADRLGPAPLVWLASGDVIIEGTVDLSGEAGHNAGSSPLPSIPGVGGFPGGTGGKRMALPTHGSGPGGGGAGSNGGGGGHAVSGQDNAINDESGEGGPAYGNPFLMPLLGGSGGGGAKVADGKSGGGGGAGGGALLIGSSTQITVNGTITARGGNGGAGSDPNFRRGGGGSGGAIRLMANTISGSGTLDADGGTILGAGGSGSHGRIRLEAYQHDFVGNARPPLQLVRPGYIFLPEDAPVVRVGSVGQEKLPEKPAGNFIIPDVNISAAGLVTVSLEARSIPPGTVLQLKLIPETGLPLEVDSSPLSGTLERSTAQARLAFPHGFSLVFVEATWTP